MEILLWQLEYLYHKNPKLRDLGWLERIKAFKKTRFKSKECQLFLAGWKAAWQLANVTIAAAMATAKTGNVKNV